MIVRTGADVWTDAGFSALRGKRVGAIVNPTSVNGRFQHLADLLSDASGVELAVLFGPEHGVRGEAQYMEPVAEASDAPASANGASGGKHGASDPRTGARVYSLYGATYESLAPRPEHLEGLDALVFDIQDVGSRYYTYVWTMALAMRAAAKAGLEFYVLDRPNPLGGVAVEGGEIEEGFHSFVGLHSVPNRHGMTPGELALLLDSELELGLRPVVVPCEGWRRAMAWEQTGLPFIPPSPNMPTPDTARVYPGACLLEGTNVSEGRGTCRPFEQLGAPYLEGATLAASLTALDLPGVAFRAVGFTPTFDKYQGVSCGGVMAHVVDQEAFRPYRTWIAAVRTIRELAPNDFAWRRDAYEFVDDVPAFDLLCGGAGIREGIDAGRPLSALWEGLEEAEGRFLVRRRPFLLYD